MMNLVVDIGNTRTKFSLFNPSGLMLTVPVKSFTPEDIDTLRQEYPSIDHCIVSAVKDYDANLKNSFSQFPGLFIELDTSTPLPLICRYETPETLGKDRIAAAVGAHFLYPGKDLLVIDAGTAITFDLVISGGEFLGGNISPGLSMRFKALHTFTGRLPLLAESADFLLIGRSTNEAILAGVQNGILFEVEKYIEHFNEYYKNLVVILTGGDINFFESNLKSYFFAERNLVAIGLNRILEYNAEQI